MPKRSSIGKRQTKPYPPWVLPACLSRWQAVRAPQLATRRRIHHCPRRSTKSFLVGRKSPTSVWRRSMSSTRKMLDHHRSSKNKGWPPEAVPAVAVASAVPTGRNLRSLRRQRSRHSIERRNLRAARTKWRPAQPPQSSFTRQAYNVLKSSPWPDVRTPGLVLTSHLLLPGPED